MFSKHELYKKDIEYIASANIDWAKIENKTIFVTGITGLIGVVLTDAIMYRNEIHNANIQVIGLTRSKQGAAKRFASYIESPLFSLVEGDVSEDINVNADVDFVINLASNTHPGLYATKPIETITSIVTGTKKVLDLASEKQVQRVVNISSVEVYGENKGDIDRFSEEYLGYIDCNTLRAGYSEGKRIAESLNQAYIAEKGLDIISARLGRVYGAPVLPTDTKATTQFMYNAVKGENIVLKSEGKQEYSCVYVADAVAALLLLLTRAQNGEAYNVSDDEVKTFRQIAQILAGTNNQEVIIDMQDNRGASTVQRALMDSTKLKALGWKANYQLQDGLIRAVAILKDIYGKKTK